MAKCHNTNTTEFVALEKAFKSKFKANSIATKWQDITRLDRLPTIDEAKELVSNEEALFTADKAKLANALLSNLTRLNFIENINGDFVVKNSMKKDFDKNMLRSNLDRISNYLAINNINIDILEYHKVPGKGMFINVNAENLKKRDVIASRNQFFTGERRQQQNTRTRHVVAHLKRIFPDVKVEFMSVNEAFDYYMNLPENQRKENFKDVRSFYDPKSGTAILIKERLTDEIAIEEILHPFINALKEDNEALYNNLLAEAKVSFPKLREEIENDYRDSAGFTQEHRDKELVTQALTRHFKFEFENKPTNTFKDLVKQFLNWFKKIINNIHKYVTGKEITDKSKQEEVDVKETLFAEDVVQNRLNIDSKYKGKIIFASTGIGKSFAAELNDRIIDSDRVYASILGVSVADMFEKLVSLTWKEKNEILKELKTTLKSLAQEGFTILTPTESLIDIADFAFIQGNPEQMVANTSSENRENPYEQTIVEAKQRINRYKERLKKADLELTVLDENNYLSDYIFVEKNPIERISRDADILLNKKLVSYLANFGISVRELENIQEQLNIDSLGFVDMLNKVAYIDESDSKELPYVAGKFIAHMMQYDPLITEIYDELKKTVYISSDVEVSEQVLKKNELLDQIGIIIGDRLLGKEATVKGVALSFSLIKLIDKLIESFLKLINKINYRRINKNVGIIVEGVLSDNKNMITASKYKPGAEGKPVKRVRFLEALKQDKFAGIIVDQFAKAGFILTGSVTLSEQGTVYRPEENQVHDLDWVSPFNRKVTREKFKELYPEAIFIRDIVNKGYVTDTYVIAPEGYRIENIEIVGWRKKVLAYDVVNKKTNEVKGTYRIVDKKEVINEDIPDGVEGKLIDFFTYPLETDDTTSSLSVELPSGQKLAISEFQKTFRAKLSYSRDKDIWDYNRYIPFEKFRELINNAKEYNTLGKGKAKTPVAETAVAGQSSINSLKKDKILSAFNAKKVIGQGGNAIVYDIPNTDFVLKVPVWGIKKETSIIETSDEIIKINDPLKGYNFGQPVATIGKAEILLRQEGIPAGLTLTKEQRENLSQEEKDLQYVKITKLAASMPQFAFDQFASNLAFLYDNDYAFDPSKSNNVLIDFNNKKFNIVDLNKLNKGETYKSDFGDMVIPLMGNTYAWNYKGDIDLAPARKEIYRKALIAAKKAGLSTLSDSSIAYSEELAGLSKEDIQGFKDFVNEDIKSETTIEEDIVNPVEATQKILTVNDLFKLIEIIEDLQSIKTEKEIDIDFSTTFSSNLDVINEFENIVNEYDSLLEEYKYNIDAYDYGGLSSYGDTIKFDFIENLMIFKSGLVDDVKSALSDLLQNEDLDLGMLYDMMFFEVGEAADNMQPEYHFLNKGDSSIKSIKDANFKLGKSIVEGIIDSYSETTDVSLSDISPEATLSDIAKLLNTEDIVFDINHQVTADIQFSLSPKRKKLMQNIKKGIFGKKPNSLQVKLLDSLTHASVKSSKEIDAFVATDYIEDQGAIVELDEATHVYSDVFDEDAEFTSVTTAISGGIKNKEDVELNLAVGKDFDSIMEGIALGKSFDDIFKDLTILNNEQANRAYDNLYDNLKMILRGGAIAIPQVIVFDKDVGIAGMIDLLIITPDGKLKIIDLKTAKHSIYKKFKGESSYKKDWELSDDSLLKQFGLANELSTEVKQSIQIGLYQRMLENMGYDISRAEDALSTFHIQVDIVGKGKNQKFKGTFKYDDWISHNPMENLPYVDALIPINDQVKLDPVEMEELIDEQHVNQDEFVTGDEILEDGELIDESEEFGVIAEGLKNFKGALINRRDAIEKIRSSIYMDRSKEETIEYIHKSISAISIILNSKNATEARALFTNLVLDSIKQVESFIDYLQDAKNINDINYITYALNVERFAVTYQGLHAVKDSITLSKTHTDLLFRLQTRLNELTGNYTTDTSIVDQAILDYVKNIIATNTLEEGITDEEYDEIVTKAQDISGYEYLTRDMATSRDKILAIMNKLYHNDKMKVMDNIQPRELRVRTAGNVLFKLSQSSDPEEIYNYMLNLDENGEWDGTYLREIGSQYYDLFDKYNSALTDPNGTLLEYRPITNLKTAKAEDVEWNIKLANKKADFAKFITAESYDDNGSYHDGDYHHYNKEFTDARAKHERWVSYGKNGEWVQRTNVTNRAWSAYRAKYYRENEYTAVKTKNKKPTGVTYTTTKTFVKNEYREINRVARNGTSMLSDRYKKLMKPTDALGRAQLEFYNLFREEFENELLTKLPIGIRNQMLGSAPVVAGKLFNSLKEKPNIITKLWAKMTRSVENLVTSTTQQRAVVTDEKGYIADSIPILYVGKPRDEAKMKEIQEEISVLKNKRQNNEINISAYKKKLKLLNGQYFALRSRPGSNEISRDLATSLIKFSQMAEHYEVMTAAEDTYNSMIKVLENREYQPSGEQELGEKVKGVFTKKGVKTGLEANVVKKAKKFMHMVYYDDEQLTKGFTDKVVDGIISYTSLSYVAFNPFGSFNNYTFGRISNNIEAIGQRHFKLKSYYRAEYEYNKRAIPSLIHRMSASAEKISGNGFYNPKLPGTLYEALVDDWRMMDDKGDLRESGNTDDSYFQRFYNFGYYMQDAAEYNVQTKVGMAVLMDTMIKNSKTGGILSLYDAYDFDAVTKRAVLKEGYDTIIIMDKKDPRKVLSEKKFDKTFKYNLRSKIREVNKQIHGNYARDDRMVMQSFALGKLAAQFHKWVAPAIAARFQKEYFDENLGWMEGRYIAFGKYLAFLGEHVMKGDLEFGTYNENFLEAYKDERGSSAQHYQKAEDKLMSFHKTTGEIMIMGLTVLLSSVLASMWGSGEDDDQDEISKITSTGDVIFLEDMREHIKRARNYLRYQADRTYKELILFVPIPGVGGLQQIYQMFKSPIASTRTLGELGEALSLSVMSPLAWLVQSGENFYANKDYVYQRGSRKGEWKVHKNWSDAVPIWYGMKKWIDYSTLSNFHIK